MNVQPQSVEPQVEVPKDVPDSIQAVKRGQPTVKKTGPSVSVEELAKTAEPFNSWPEIIALMKNYSTVIATAFRGSNAYVSGDYMLIDASEYAFDLLRKASQRDKIRELVQQVAGRPYKLGPYRAPAKENEQKDPLESFLQDMRDSGVEIEEK